MDATLAKAFAIKQKDIAYQKRRADHAKLPVNTQRHKMLALLASHQVVLISGVTFPSVVLLLGKWVE